MPKKKKSPVREMEISMVGFNHRAIAETRREIAAECPLAVALIREPDNPHDPSAIMVHLQEKPWKGMHVGYVPRALAGMLALKIDLDEISIERAWLQEVDPEEGTGQLLLKVIKRKAPKA